ncbi:cytochrome P450 [Obba rivulosa]|uniref:Cytochrome P450 n=1 Tax=Obba rivulosa TaxID=1052685 RepID=A0A8E2DGL3_9APHY|nr:cytochrome P450 [Obba rivulosa]
MNLIASALSTLVLAGVAFAVIKIARFLIQPYFSSLRYLPGPPSPSFIFGNFKAIFDGDNVSLHEAWVERYGHTIKYKGFLNNDRFYTMDLKAINHFLTHSSDYQKPAQSRFVLSSILGEGLLFVEESRFRTWTNSRVNQHFVDQARQLREFWEFELSKVGDFARIDAFDGLTKATLNIIGLAGFNYEFDALNPGRKNELHEAFFTIFSTTERGSFIWPLLQGLFPPLRFIPNARMRRLEHARTVMRRIGMQLVAEKKASVRQALAGEKFGSVDTKALHGRDLLTVLIKANMASDLADNLRLSDEDVLWQVPTFLVAGHETTSSATTWCLYALTQAPEAQRKLRAELFTLLTDTPTMDELNALPYLDAVVRETLRVHAPVASSSRQAVKDDIVPLSTPFTDARGEVHDTSKVDKGAQFFLPVQAINRSRELWGEDAHEFKPERWESLPETVSSIPGVWGHLLTFSGGPRSCIGYRFSLVEMKALIFTLVRAFEFELAVPPEEITKKHLLVQRPLVKSELEKGSQMPLLVKRYEHL